MADTYAAHGSHPAVRLILLAVPPAMGLVALWFGQDICWDLRNYHYYNPFAWLTGRMGYDVAMGQVATYYNPLMHLPFYLAVKTLPPMAVGFILGVLPGCNVFLLYTIAKHTIKSDQPDRQSWLCLVIALAGLLGAGFISEIGTSYGDSVLSLLVLGSVAVLAAWRRQLAAGGRKGWMAAAGAGVLAGAAFGLKQPFAVYAVGLCAAFFGLQLPWRRRFGLAFVFGLGVLAGAAATGGFWMLDMWQRFGNPLFPYFNQYFQSPWGSPAPYRDERFIPKDLRSALLFPFVFTLNPFAVAEVPFRDLRFVLLYLFLIGAAVRTWVLRSRPAQTNPVGAARSGQDAVSMQGFLIVFTIISFVVWMKLFAVYRYLMVGELLAPLVIFLLVGLLVKHKKRRMGLALGCLVLLIVSLRPAAWGRQSWGAEYFGVAVPQISEPADTLVLAAGFEPMAYMIPFFPSQVRFLRIHSYMTGPSAQPNGLDRLMRSLIDGHGGAIFMLYRSYEENIALASLSAYGLELDKTDCRTFTPRLDPQTEQPFFFCRAEKSMEAPEDRP